MTHSFPPRRSAVRGPWPGSRAPGTGEGQDRNHEAPRESRTPPAGHLRLAAFVACRDSADDIRLLAFSRDAVGESVQPGDAAPPARVRWRRELLRSLC